MTERRAAVWLVVLARGPGRDRLTGNAGIVFALLVALMLSGMPVSIVGLTCSRFLFLCPRAGRGGGAEAVPGIERFESWRSRSSSSPAGFSRTRGGEAHDRLRTSLGAWHGGLALAGDRACALFALVCGSSVATVVAIGSILLPAMVKQGYPMRFGAAVIITAGSLGILMLPSIPR